MTGKLLIFELRKWRIAAGLATAIVLFVCLHAFDASLHVHSQSGDSKQPRVDLVVQTGHSDAVRSIAFSPDGRLLASGSADNTVKLWDVATGREIRTFYGHSNEVSSVAFSPDGETLASAGWDFRVFLWDVATGKQVRLLSGHPEMINSVAFSSDGLTLASRSNGQPVMLWDAASGALLRETGNKPNPDYSVLKRAGRTLAFGPKGDVLAFADTDGRSVMLFDQRNGRAINTLIGHREFVHSVAFTSDGTKLVTADRSEIRIWDAATGRLIGKPIAPVAGSGSADLLSIDVSADGKMIGGINASGKIVLWNISDGRRIAEINAQKGSVAREPSSITFAPDGRSIAVNGAGNSIRMLNIPGGSEIRSFAGRAVETYKLRISPDGRRLATSGEPNTVKVWDLATSDTLRSFKTGVEHPEALEFSPDSASLAIAGYTTDFDTYVEKGTDNKVEILDASDGKTLSRFVDRKSYLGSGSGLVTFASDGRLILAGNTSAILWQAGASREFDYYRSDTSQFPDAVTIDPSRQMLAGAFSNGTVVIWDAAGGQQLKTLPCGHRGAKALTAFSPDGKFLASSSFGHAQICNVETGEKVKEFWSDSLWGGFVAFSPDSRLLASISFGGTLSVWDLESEKDPRIFARQDHFQSQKYYREDSLAFSPDGKLLFSTSGGRIKIWNVATGIEIATLVALGGDDWVVTAPDGRFDTSKDLDAIEGLHWVVSDDPLEPVPLELFVRDYFEPGLLPRLVRCNIEDNCASEFPPLPNISDLNRVRPTVRVSDVSLPDVQRRVKVRIEIENGRLSEKACKMAKCDTRAYDLRVFRDGKIVASFPQGAQAELVKLSSTVKQPREEKEKWRELTAISPDPVSNCRGGNKNCTVRTFEVQLPIGKDAADVEFSAYAFNEDRVKSDTAYWSRSNWGKQKLSRLPKAEPVRPKAYVISIGVNASDVSDWNLSLAVRDAEQTQRVLTDSLKSQFDVIPVKLVSEFGGSGGYSVKTAIKENFIVLFDVLTGRPVSDAVRRSLPNWQRLQKASPDDAVFISISSHGYVDASGRFYVLPADVRRAAGSQRLPAVESMISADELSLWLRGVDAGEMVLIIDACYAEASVTGPGFKPAPIGDRGLGQLAYDKRMRVLTATRQKDEAIEVRKNINQGLLTAALLQGLDEGLADFDPAPDGRIWLAEWLKFATKRVPELFLAVQKGESKGVVFGKSAGFASKSATFLQTPVLFDFRKADVSDLELVRNGSAVRTGGVKKN